MAAGPAQGGQAFLLLGSGSGTSPGLGLGVHHLPLNPDPYFDFTLLLPNTSPLSGSLGLLDAKGVPIVPVELSVAPQSIPPQLAGLTLDHAYVVLDAFGPGGILAVSPAVSLTLTP